MLEVRNLYKSFDVAGKRQRVIEDLSFVVQDRDFYMILGQSGWGKSTLLRMLGGFEGWLVWKDVWTVIRTSFPVG